MGGKLSMSALSNALIKSLVVVPTGMNSTANSLSYYIRKLSLKIDDRGAVRHLENESMWKGLETWYLDIGSLLLAKYNNTKSENC